MTQAIRNFIKGFFPRFKFEEIIENHKEFKFFVKSETFLPKSKEAIENSLKFLKGGDWLKLSVLIGGNDPLNFSSQSWNLDEFITSVKESIDLQMEEEPYRVELTIYKDVSQGRISVFSLDEFWKHLVHRSIYDFLILLDKIRGDSNYILFDLNEDLAPFGTSFIFFQNTTLYGSIDGKEMSRMREERLKKWELACNFQNRSRLVFIPEDFSLTRSEDVDIMFVDYFQRVKTLFALAYIFDSTRIKENSISYRLHGHRTFEGELDLKIALEKDYSGYYEIYQWAYEGGNITDKIGLVRNILSLSFSRESKVALKGRPLASIRSGFNLYLKENIREYLSLRRDLLSDLLKMSDKAVKIGDSFVLNFQRSIFSFLSFFASLVVIRVLGKGGFEKVFSPEATTLSALFLTGTLFYYILSQWEISSALKRLEKQYNRVKNRFSDLLTPEDISRILEHDKEYDLMVETIDQKRMAYSILWLVLIVMFGVAIHILS